MPSIAQLERLLAADPTDAFVLYGLAQEHARSGNVPRAIEFFDRCIATDPNYTYAYYHKARVLLDAGRSEDATAAARSGVEVARRANDDKALSELTALLDQIE